MFFANASEAFAMLASRFLYESDMMWLNNKWLMIDDRNFLKMRHGDDSVMEVSRTPSGARDAVHRIYLGRTVIPQLPVLLISTRPLYLGKVLLGKNHQGSSFYITLFSPGTSKLYGARFSRILPQTLDAIFGPQRSLRPPW